MKDHEDILKRIEGLCEELKTDEERRARVIGMLSRDMALPLDALEKQAEKQKRLDALKLKDHAHKLNERIVEILSKDEPDTALAMRLLLTKNILESDIDPDNAQAFKARADACKSLAAEQTISAPGKNVTF